MRLTSFINNSKCIEWDLTMQQGALFDLLNQLHSWADPVTIDGSVYYWASKQMICDELPLAYSKVDTVYRALKLLSEKGLINYKKHGEKDCVSLTQKGKEWNSDSNPNLGNKSEPTRKIIRNNSDLNPTYKNTNNNTTKINTKKINKKDSFDPVSVKPKNLSIETWMNWIKYKSDNKQKLQPQSWEAQSKMLEQQTNPEEIINLSIMNGWQGLFPDRVGAKSPSKKQPAKSFATQNYGETKQPEWARG